MIISCEKCNKKFELSNDLIPSKGRTLQCGSCSYKWHFIPLKKSETIEKIQKKTTLEMDFKNDVVQENSNFNETNFKNNKKNKKIGFLSYLLVLIITFIALIILAETFEPLISLYITGFDFYLTSLHESLKDIFLFFKDLIK